MAKSDMESRSSLERLKALGELPDLTQQLEVARVLCTHSARAEMILRWLLSTMRDSSVARSSRQSWELLLLCIKLLPGRKIASVVASNGLIDVFRSSCGQSDLAFDTVTAMGILLNNLLNIGNDEGCTAIKSLISLASTDAAVVCGQWFRHVCSGVDTAEAHLVVTNHNLIEPGIQLWSLRKRTDIDHIAFCNHALVPATLLLSLLSNYKEVPSLKRKRGQSSQDTLRFYVQALESMVAKDFIMPLRHVFFQRPDGPSHSTIKDLPDMVQIGRYFAAVDTELSGTASEDRLLLPTKLLDITIRSVALSSPKQRLRERPWIESSFAALQNCLRHVDSRAKNSVLSRMLKTLYRHRLTLSPSTLTSIVTSDALTERADQQADWPLISTICSIDPSPFMIIDTARNVMEHISREDETPTTAQCDGRYNSMSLRQQVVLPMMSAFAQSRNLAAFADLWYEQLQGTASSQVSHLWIELRDDFGNAVQNSLTADQCLERIDSYLARLSRLLLKALPNDEWRADLIACAIVLAGFIDGARTEEYQDKMAAGVKSLLDALVNAQFPTALDASPKLRASIAILLETALRNHFPSLVVKQSDPAIVDVLATQLLDGGVLDFAWQGDVDSKHPDEAVQPMAWTGKVRQYAAQTLFNTFEPYREQPRSKELCDRMLLLCDKSKTQALSLPEGIIDRPASIGQVEAMDIVIHDVLSSNEDSANARLAPLEAMLAMSYRSKDTAVFEHVLSTLLGQLKPGLDTNTIAKERAVLTLLDGIPSASLTRAQCTEILDAIIALPELEINTLSEWQLNQRFAILLKFIRYPHDDAQIFTDWSRIWHLANMGYLNFQPRSGFYRDAFQSPETLENFEALTKILVSQWLKEQNDPRHKELLIKQSEHARQIMELCCKSPPLSTLNRRGLLLVKVLVESLEDGANERLIPQLTHRSTQDLSDYIDWLLERAKADSADLEQQSRTTLSTLDSRCIDAIIGIPGRTISTLAASAAQYLESFVEVALNMLEKLCAMESEAIQETSQQAIISRCYEIACQYAAEEATSFSALTLEVLALRLTVVTQMNVLSHFEDVCKKSGLSWRRDVLHSIMIPANQHSWAALRLQQIVVRGIDKVDFNSDSDAGINIQNIADYAIKAISVCDDLRASAIALGSLTMLMKEKPFMVNQYSIEETLRALQNVVRRQDNAIVLFMDICQVLTAILTHHRSRLQGRFHLLVTIFQDMLSSLFITARRTKQLAIRQARTLARLLALYCDPPHMRHRNKSSDLVDEARKEKAHVGQFVPFVLHDYCSKILTNGMEGELREALIPGIWAMIEAIELNSSDGIRVISAAMNNSERAVLRSLYEDWKRFGKWEGQ